MERIMISELSKKIGQEVKIGGFVETIRDQGSIKFLILRDRSGTIQTVFSKQAKEAFELASELTLESVVYLTGKVKEEQQAPGGLEIEAITLEVLSKAEPELAIPVAEKIKQEPSQDKRLDWRYLDLRRKKQRLIFEVWTTFEIAFKEFLVGKGFIQIHSPKLMSAPSESGAEVFEVKYFEGKAYLAQSPQFYKQMAMCAGFEKVFEIGSVFRAEPSFTTRHLTEYTSYDLEISFIDSHLDIMKLESEVLQYCFEQVKKKHGQEIKTVFGLDIEIPSLPFPEVTMEQAKIWLAEKGVAS